MKFDFCIGNPPYQDSESVNNRQGAVYQHFYDAASMISNKYMLISPARFLFNTGLTSKDWNKKMLSDKHLKVEQYYQNASSVFSNTEIKGGIAIMYRDSSVEFGAIEEFIPNEELRKVAKRFIKDAANNFSSIVFSGRSDLKFNDLFLKDYPNTIKDRILSIKKKHSDVVELSPNEEYEIKSSTFDVLPYVFKDTKPQNDSDYYKLLGLTKGKRTEKWIEKKYLEPRYPDNNNVAYYKVIIPESNNNGEFGETFSNPLIAEPFTSSTPTFIAIGKYKTQVEAENTLKYMKTKLTRALMGILKKTQHNPASVWAYIPLQDFTENSDINWNASIAEIDQQLYRKYGLSEEEINFIETHVKEMK